MFLMEIFGKNLKKVYICIVKNLKKVYNMAVRKSQKGADSIFMKRKIYQQLLDWKEKR